MIIHSDGGARGNPGPGACAFTAEENGRIIGKGSRYLGKVTNNLAEYSGVLLALNWLTEHRQTLLDGPIIFYLDSELIVKQLDGLYKTKNKTLIKLNGEVKDLIEKNKLKVAFRNIPRAKNKLADLLVNKKLDEIRSG